MSGNAPKILVVVLVVVAVLFFAGIAIGANNGVGGVSLEGVINSLAGLMPSPAVGADAIASSPDGCFDRGLQRIFVPSGGRCDLQIAPSSATVRSLKLKVAGGQGVHLALTVEPVEDKPLVIDTDLPKDGNDQMSLSIFAEGGTLILDGCTAGVGGSCIVDLVQ